MNVIRPTGIWVHRNTLVFCDRGKQKVFLPNTAPSIRNAYKAFQLSGVEAVEIDLLGSKEGDPFVFNPFSPYALGTYPDEHEKAGQKRKIFDLYNSEIRSIRPNIENEQAFLSKRYGEIEIFDENISIPFLKDIDKPLGLEKLDLDVIKLDPNYIDNPVRNKIISEIANWIRLQQLEKNVIITGTPYVLEEFRKLLGDNVEMCLAIPRLDFQVEEQIRACTEIGIQYASPNTVQVLDNLQMIKHFSSRDVNLVPAEIRDAGKDGKTVKEIELEAMRILMENEISGVKTNFVQEASEIRKEVFRL